MAKPQSKPGGRSPRTLRNAREVAAGVVAAVLDDGKFVGPALDSALSQSALDDRDRGLCTELALGTLRWAVPLEASLLRGANKPGRGLDKRLRPHLLVAAYQLQHLHERVPAHAAVSEAMKLVVKTRPGLRGFSNALLRKLGSPLHEMLPKAPTREALAEAYGIPLPLVDVTCAGLPAEDWKPAVEALNARPPLSIAVLDPRESEAVIAALGPNPAADDDDNDNARRFQPHPFVDGVFTAHGAGAPERLPGFSEGQFIVQDPGSRLVAQLAAPRRGARVVDLCAAPGTKTVGLAVAAGIRGSVTAVDVDGRRLALVEEGATRAAAHAAPVATVVADARSFATDGENHRAYDVVLLDAPCSALGTTRRHPEVCRRWEEEAKKSENAPHAVLQWELLAAATALVAEGGALVYAVCSPMPDEGVNQLKRFEREFGDAFVVVEANESLPSLPPDAVDDHGALRLRPHLHAADAFYAFRAERKQ